MRGEITSPTWDVFVDLFIFKENEELEKRIEKDDLVREKRRLEQAEGEKEPEHEADKPELSSAPEQPTPDQPDIKGDFEKTSSSAQAEEKQPATSGVQEPLQHWNYPYAGMNNAMYMQMIAQQQNMAPPGGDKNAPPSSRGQQAAFPPGFHPGMAGFMPYPPAFMMRQQGSQQQRPGEGFVYPPMGYIPMPPQGGAGGQQASFAAGQVPPMGFYPNFGPQSAQGQQRHHQQPPPPEKQDQKK
ncbi:hypothetical protein MHBO_003414 [Bonamia ostreae]|uniref:Uncharacterized protein n=1 Tax=Bonamia ostreae TaxID=126728 RepID=A0ABV2AQG1_9EUKA